jgi:hypothetical protein
MAEAIVETQAKPNETARQRPAVELTLGDAFARYRHHIATRTQRPATKETLRVADRAARKFEAWKWGAKKVRDLARDEIAARFHEGRSDHPTANEQAFCWASAALKWALETEAHDAEAAGRLPLLRTNLFAVLSLNKMYRSRNRVERAREEEGKRNPLTRLRPSERFWRSRGPSGQ